MPTALPIRQITSGRPWSQAADELLRRYWQRTLTAKLAYVMDRTREEVSVRAYEIGVSKKRPDGYLPSDISREIVRLHGEGMNDSQIAEVIGESRRSVQVWRDALGLPVIGRNEEANNRTRRAMKAQCRRAGLRNLAELRANSYREFARRRGWPAEMAPREVQILDLLYEHGPHTRRQICEALDIEWRGVRHSMCSSSAGGSYLATLQRRGFVLGLRKAVKQAGSGNNVSLYLVAPQIIRRRPETWPRNDVACSKLRKSTTRKSRKA